MSMETTPKELCAAQAVRASESAGRAIDEFYQVEWSTSLSNGVQLFLLDLGRNIEKINKSIIPVTQLTEILRYRRIIDIHKRLLARSFLFEFVNQRYGLLDFSFSYNQFQKPFLASKASLNFSFSYAGPYVLVGISDGLKLGVDIEQVDSKFETLDVAPDIMCSDELKRFQLLPPNSWQQFLFFFRLFSAKEAIIKAFGKGLFFDVKTISTLSSSQYCFEDAKYECEEQCLWNGKYVLFTCYEKK